MIDIKLVQDLALSASIIIPLITGLVQVIKSVFYIDSRYIPLIDLIFGIGAGLVFVGLSPIGAIVGIMLGLGANGLWEFGSKTIANK